MKFNWIKSSIDDINAPKLLDTETGHFYQIYTGDVFTSVTAKLKAYYNKDQFINKWIEEQGKQKADYILQRAGEYGTDTHKIIEDYLNNRKTSIKNPMAVGHHHNMKKLLDKINNIYATEQKLYSLKYEIAGTADCIAEYDGILSIIDFKTARKMKRKEWIEDYFVQATIYSMLIRELTGINISQLVIIMSGEDGLVKSFIEKTSDYEKLAEKILSM